MTLKILTGFFLTLFSIQIFAGVKVTGIDLKLSSDKGTVITTFSGGFTELPDLKILDNIIELQIEDADQFELINKKTHGVNLFASKVNSKANIRAILPYRVSSDEIQTKFLKNQIEITFPRNKPSQKVEKVLTEIQPEVSLKKVDTSHLNESYLNNLMEEKSIQENKKILPTTDKVSTKMSSSTEVNPPVPNKKKEEEFSFVSYVFKFGFFLTLVLGIFYGLVQIMKKGVLSKGKLSFLTNSKLVEVLNTTYISPKRSLVLVKVHNQVFLVSNAENGLNFMTEIRDTTSLIKETEKTITGSNFDESYIKFEQNEDQRVNLKEDIYTSTQEVTTAEILKKDVVKFSEELKKKAKKLKPIENRVN